MVTSIFRTFRSNRIDSALRYDESDRLESLLAIACDGSAEDCYDEPGGEVPPSQPNPSGTGPSKPSGKGKGKGGATEALARLAETLFGAMAPAPTTA